MRVKYACYECSKNSTYKNNLGPSTVGRTIVEKMLIERIASQLSVVVRWDIHLPERTISFEGISIQIKVGETTGALAW